MTFYGTDVWDPQLILAQMAVLQCLHYLTVGLLLAMAHWVLGEPVTLDMIFSFKIVSFSTSVGWLACVVHLLAGLAGACYLVVVVERVKKCLDFAVTMYMFHLLACWLYGGFPYTWSWWTLNVSAAMSMVVLGEYLCLRRESQDIELDGFFGALSAPRPSRRTE